MNANRDSATGNRKWDNLKEKNRIREGVDKTGYVDAYSQNWGFASQWDHW